MMASVVPFGLIELLQYPRFGKRVRTLWINFPVCNDKTTCTVRYIRLHRFEGLIEPDILQSSRVQPGLLS